MTNTPYRPNDIDLPPGWTWARVEQERAKWGIADNMVPVASVSGACTAWGTIGFERMKAARGER